MHYKSKTNTNNNQNNNTNSRTSSRNRSVNNNNNRTYYNKPENYNNKVIGKGTVDETVKQEKITIHVCDETKKINKDFICEKSVLLKRMKYFEKYLNENSSADDIDISVHCDVQIFEWLMQFINAAEEEKPKLDLNNIVSILISSEFLQMEDLLDLCTKFFSAHAQDVVKLPIDMSCISASVQKRIAVHIGIDALEELKDKKDKLRSKLFTKKLELLLQDELNQLGKCQQCNSLFAVKHRDSLVCNRSKIFIDFYGNIIAKHMSDPSFVLDKFIHYMKNNASLSWEEIYWRVYARTLVFRCANCAEYFSAAEFGFCTFHPQKATFAQGSNRGHYPCCAQETMRFDTKVSRGGCCSKNHLLDLTDPAVVDGYSVIKKRMGKVVEPFIKPEGLNASRPIKHVNIGEANDDTNDEKLEISKEKSTDILVEMFTLLDRKNQVDSDEDEDEDSKDEEDQESTQPAATSATSATAKPTSLRANSNSANLVGRNTTGTPLNKPNSASGTGATSVVPAHPKPLNNSKYNSHPSSDSDRYMDSSDSDYYSDDGKGTRMLKTDSRANIDRDERRKKNANHRRLMLNKNISRDKRKIWREDQMRLQDKLCMEYLIYHLKNTLK